MWKRWSKSLDTNAIIPDESRASKQTADPPHQAPSDQGLSTAPGLKSHATNPGGSTQETVSDAPVKAEDNANPPPILQNMVHGGSDKQSTAPVTYCKSSSTESASPVSSDALILRETVSPPAITLPTIRAESRSPARKPVTVEAKSNDTFPCFPGTIVDTSALANTLLTPDPESLDLPSRRRRLSFRSLAFFYGRDKETTPTSSLNPTTLTPVAQTQEKSNSSNISQPKLSRAQKEALLSAITLQMLFIGPSPPPLSLETVISPKKMKKSHQSKFATTLPLPSLKKVKAQLLKPESANAIICQLRRLPLSGGSSIHASNCLNLQSPATHLDGGIGPIHAVCLPCTDEEAEQTYFSRFRSGQAPSSSLDPPPTTSSSTPNIVTASLESLISVFRDLHIVSLLASPDFGFGQPVSDNGKSGILSGSVPSPETLLDGFEEITKQLMMLGFATSKTVLPDHTGVYPPNDRISVLTYWWGLELVLPESSVQYLGKVKSISNTLLNFLSALALFNNGIREALPFVRYIANFVDFEWSAIQKQDKGRGVVCAATWVMPAAMVPRPWDFPSRPQTPPGSPAPPTSPASPKTSPTKDEAPTGEKDTPTNLAPEHPDPPNPSDTLYPATPAMPMMPQLLVTPATLPRNLHVPQ